MNKLQNKLFEVKSWYYLPLIYLLITALFGVLLRVLKIWDLGFNYVYILHTHSHLALLGWSFGSLFLFLVNSFVPNNLKSKRQYSIIFYSFQVTVIGMLLFFPSQGYGSATIVFSSLFLLVGYWFSYRFLKDTRSKLTPHPISVRFAKTAIFFFILSSIGPWALGPLNMNGLGGSDLYFNCIYFYLHFLYNGWFIFGILALCFAYLDRSSITYKTKWAVVAYRYLLLGTVLGYSLSTLWIGPPKWVHFIGLIGAFMQLVAIYYLILIAKETIKKTQLLNGKWLKLLSYNIFVCFLLKLVLQVFSAFPDLAELIAVIRDWVIAYLHIVLLGCVAPSLLLLYYRYLANNVVSKVGIGGVTIFLIGFWLNELFMVVKGLISWLKLSYVDFRIALLSAALLILCGVFLVTIDLLKTQRTINKAF